MIAGLMQNQQNADHFTGLAGVILWTSVSKFNAMRDFYTRKLNLQPLHSRAQFINFAWGDSPSGIRLTVTVHSEITGANKDPNRVMVNFYVTDIWSVSKDLKTRGVVFTREPEQESWGGWIATFQDPDMNTLQLLQPAP